MAGLVEYSEGSGRYQALTREDSHKIQVIMNVVLRALTNLNNDTPVWQLVKVSGFLSFHQMCAFSTICSTHKILIHKEPKYLFDILVEGRQDIGRPRRAGTSSTLPFKLSISRESFLYQGWRLYSRIPETLTAM